MYTSLPTHEDYYDGDDDDDEEAGVIRRRPASPSGDSGYEGRFRSPDADPEYFDEPPRPELPRERLLFSSANALLRVRSTPARPVLPLSTRDPSAAGEFSEAAPVPAAQAHQGHAPGGLILPWEGDHRSLCTWTPPPKTRRTLISS